MCDPQQRRGAFPAAIREPADEAKDALAPAALDQRRGHGHAQDTSGSGTPHRDQRIDRDPVQVTPSAHFMEDRAKTLQLVVAEEDVDVGVYEADQKIPRELLQHAGENRVGVASYDAGRIAHRYADRLVKPGHGTERGASTKRRRGQAGR